MKPKSPVRRTEQLFAVSDDLGPQHEYECACVSVRVHSVACTHGMLRVASLHTVCVLWHDLDRAHPGPNTNKRHHGSPGRRGLEGVDVGKNVCSRASFTGQASVYLSRNT